MNTKERSSRIVKNTLVLYMRMLFLLVINIYSSRVILQALGVIDYGVYNVVGGFVALFSLISSALSGASSRFINYEMGTGDDKRLQLIFSSSLTIQILLVLIVGFLTETVGIWYLETKMVIPAERMNAARWCFQFSVVSFSLGLLSVPFNAEIIAHERMSAFAYVSILEGVMKLVISFMVMRPVGDRLVYYASLLLMTKIAVQLTYYLYCKKNFSECEYSFVFDRPLLRKMFSYAGWHIIGNSAGIMKTHGVNLILNLFFGPSVNAARGVANQVLTAVVGFASNFMMAIGPQITQSYAKKDYQYMLQLMHKGSKYSIYLLALVSLPVIVSADYLLGIWLDEVPKYAVMFTRLILVVALLNYLSGTLITAQNATGNVKWYQIIVGSVQLLNLPLSYAVLKLGSSPVSVMVVAIAVEIVAMLTRICLIPHYIPGFSASGFLRNVVLKSVSVVSIACVFPALLRLKLPQDFLSFLIISATCLASSILCILFIGCDKNERQYVYCKCRDWYEHILNNRERLI